MTVVEKLCLECNQPLFGRIDKKFCNDYCRNSYNNRSNKVANDYVRKVNVILRKNRKIITSLLNGKEKTITTKENFYLTDLTSIILLTLIKLNKIECTILCMNWVIFHWKMINMPLW